MCLSTCIINCSSKLELSRRMYHGILKWVFDLLLRCHEMSQRSLQTCPENCFRIVEALFSLLCKFAKILTNSEEDPTALQTDSAEVLRSAEDKPSARRRPALFSGRLQRLKKGAASWPTSLQICMTFVRVFDNFLRYDKKYVCIHS